MSCRITRNEEGNIVRVDDANGKESKLFNQIAKFPHVENMEQALEVYNEILKIKNNANILNKEAQREVRKSNSISEIHQSLKTFIGGYAETVERDNPLESRAQLERETIAIEQWAKTNEYFIEDMTEDYKETDLGGAESEIYLNPENTGVIIKEMNPGAYNGYAGVLGRIELHNELFPETAYQLIGFTKEGSVLNIVLQQDYVEGAEQATPEAISEYLTDMGFEIEGSQSGTYIWKNKDGITIGDMHTGNALVRKEDGVIVVIDPMIEYNGQIALQEYLDSSSESVESISDPKIIIESDNNTYPTFRDALKNTNSNTIEISVKGKTVFTMPSTTDERVFAGVVNTLIKSSILSSDKVIYDGKTYFQPEGINDFEKGVALEYLKEELEQLLDRDQYSIKDGLVGLRDLDREDIPENTPADIINSGILALSKQIPTSNEPIDENNLKQNLYQILNNLGVSVTSLSEYQKKEAYKANDIPPSAQALADLTNKVVAFREGQETVENLTEEVMHLIVETLPAEQLQELSDFIKASKEYQLHYEEYSDVYKGNEELIEKEILGKILKNITLGKLEGKSATEASNGISLVEQFFDNINVTDTIREQLESLNNLVDRLVIQQTSRLNDKSLPEQDRIVRLYSLGTKTQKASEAFQKSLNNAREFTEYRSYARQLRNTNFDKLSGESLKDGILDMLETTTGLIDIVDSAMKNNQGKPVTEARQAVLEELSDSIKEHLISLKNELSRDQEGITRKQAEKMRENIEKKVSKILDLAEENKVRSGKNVNSIAKKASKSVGALEGSFLSDHLEKATQGEYNDVNMIFSYFGQLHHASNPIVNLIGKEVYKMNTRKNQTIKEIASTFLNMAEDMGVDKKVIDSFYNNDYGFMRDIVDHKAIEDANDLVDLLAYEKITKNKIEEDTTFNESRYNADLIFEELSKHNPQLTRKKVLSGLKRLETYKKRKSLKEEKGDLKPLPTLEKELYNKYRLEKEAAQELLNESPMNAEYYRKRDEKLKDFADATKVYLKDSSSQRAAIRRRATKIVDGKEVVLFTPQDKSDLRSVSKGRKAKKHIYDQNHEIKPGLKIVDTPTKDSIPLNSGGHLVLSENPSDNAQIAYDLHKMDYQYRLDIESGKETPTSTSDFALTSLFAEIENLSREEDKIDHIKANIDLSLTQQFYDELEGDHFITSEEFENLNTNEDGVVNPSVYRLRKLYNKRSSILSVYRDPSSPIEILELTRQDQEEIKELTEYIGIEMRRLKKPKYEEQANSIAEKTPNISYRNAIKSQKIQEGSIDELEFVKKHSDTTRYSEVKDLYIKKSQGVILSEKQEAFISRFYQEGDALEEVLLKYSKANLLPYYTRFSKVGYKSLEERVDAGENPLIVLKEMLEDPYIDVRVDRSFEGEDNPMINPKYKKDYIGGLRQPKAGTFVDKSFVEEYGINDKGEATKKVELFKLRNAMLNAKVQSHKLQDDKGNPFKMPQISKSLTEKIKTIFNLETTLKNKWSQLLEIFKDLLAYRVDDKAYGEEGFKASKMLPKYYTDELENPLDVSTDHMFALTQFVSRSAEYKSKKDSLADINSLYNSLVKSKRDSREKTLKNTIKMVESFIDENVYGKIEGWKYGVKVPGTDFEMDIAKITRLFSKYVSLKNLGFNTIVPITGALTAGASKMIEQTIGEKLNWEAAKLGNRSFKKMMAESMKSSMDINDNSELFLIGQAFNQYNLEERTKNAKYTKFQRTFSKSAMILHQVSNYMVTPRVVLSILHDHRIVEDKIQTRQQFMQEGIREGKDRDALKSQWKTLEDKAVIHYMNFTKEGFSWKEGTGLSEEYLQQKKESIADYMSDTVSAIEGQIPQSNKTMAQRNSLISMALMHRGYLSIFLQRRFKNRNLNLQSGLVEEGSYRTATKVFKDFFNTDQDSRTFMENVKALYGNIKPPTRTNETDEQWREKMLDYELETRNMSRVSKEIGAMLLLTMLGSLVFAAASDPDNEDEYMIQMTSYLTTRLLNESGTALSPSILTDIGGVIESPIIAYDTAKQLTESYKLFDGEDIKYGKYKGMTQSTRWMTKNIIGGKGIFDLRNVDNIKANESSYRLYNEVNINRSSLFLNEALKLAYKDK